ENGGGSGGDDGNFARRGGQARDTGATPAAQARGSARRGDGTVDDQRAASGEWSDHVSGGGSRERDARWSGNRRGWRRCDGRGAAGEGSDGGDDDEDTCKRWHSDRASGTGRGNGDVDARAAARFTSASGGRANGGGDQTARRLAGR